MPVQHEKLQKILILPLLTFSYIVYLSIGITEFPPYFFCDEAIQGAEAFSLISRGVDRHGAPWPVFIKGHGEYHLSATVYLQIPFILLFGLNEFAVRLCTAVSTAIAPASVFLLLRSLGHRMCWLSFPIFALAPFWFMHARTGFEVMTACSFYVAFVSFYIMHIDKGWRYLVVAATCATFSFYSYLPARGWVLALSVFFLLGNAAHHYKHRWSTLGTALFAALVMAPFVLFSLQDESATKRMYSIGFGQTLEKPFADQVSFVGGNVFKALNPYTWMRPNWLGNGVANERHIVPGLFPIPPLISLAALVGLALALRRCRRYTEKSLILALIAPIFPASMANINYLRTFGVGTIYLVFACYSITWLALKVPPHRRQMANLIAIVLVNSTACFLLYWTLAVAPLRYKDYGFGGLQSGAAKLFGWLKRHEHEYNHAYIRHDLFNAGPVMKEFFIANQDLENRIHFSSLMERCERHDPNSKGDILVRLGPASENKLEHTDCPLELTLLDTLSIVPGRLEFNIMRINILPLLARWQQAAKNQRRQLRKSELDSDLGHLEIYGPELGHGRWIDLFDKNIETVIRFDRINPVSFSIGLAKSISIDEIYVATTHMTKADFKIDLMHKGKLAHQLSRRAITKNGKPTLRIQVPHIETDTIKVRIHRFAEGDHASPHLAEIHWSRFTPMTEAGSQ
jgi:hypothetical protein